MKTQSGIAGVNLHHFAFKLDCTVHLAENLPCNLQIITANCGGTHNIKARLLRASSRSISFFFLWLWSSRAVKCASWDNLVVRRESYQRRSPEAKANIGNQLTAARKYWIFSFSVFSYSFLRLLQQCPWQQKANCSSDSWRKLASRKWSVCIYRI